MRPTRQPTAPPPHIVQLLKFIFYLLYTSNRHHFPTILPIQFELPKQMKGIFFLNHQNNYFFHMNLVFRSSILLKLKLVRKKYNLSFKFIYFYLPLVFLSFLLIISIFFFIFSLNFFENQTYSQGLHFLIFFIEC